MTATVILLLVLTGSIAALPGTERGAGAIAGMAALITGAVLACTEAGLLMAPSRWLFAVALALAILNHLLGVGQADAGKNKSELR